MILNLISISAYLRPDLSEPDWSRKCSNLEALFFAECHTRLDFSCILLKSSFLFGF